MLGSIIFKIVYNIAIFLSANEVCKWNSAYFPEIRCKRYIIIKNYTIEKILIPRRVGSDRFVDLWDYDKMSIVGLVAYIVITPVNMLNCIIQILYEFNYKGIGNIKNLSYIILGILIMLSIINMVTFIINTWDCGRK